MALTEGLALLNETEERAFRNMDYAITYWASYGLRLSGIELAVAARGPARIQARACACFRCDDSGDRNIVNPDGILAGKLRLIMQQAQVVTNCRRLREKISACAGREEKL